MQAYRIKTVLFTLLICWVNLSSIAVRGQAPTIQDCLGAIPICEPIYVEANAPTGSGNYTNEINSFLCCMANENNSIWYTFTVNQTGDFGFELIPNDLDDDYDWALFNITNAQCSDITSDFELMVSCNAAGGGSCQGITGANGNTTYQIQGAGCNNTPPNINVALNPFNALVSVQENNTYALVISNWTGSTNGYTIDFGLSAGIGIYDTAPPSTQVTDVPTDCEDATIQILFSENIKCESISAANFELVGPGGPYTVELDAPICEVGGSYEKAYTLRIDPPITEGGNYEVNLVLNSPTEVLDLCDNQALPFSHTFTIAPFEVSIDLGLPEITICETEVLELDASFPDADYIWHDGFTEAQRTVANEGIYSVTVSTPCASDTDEVIVNYYVDTLMVNFGGDTILCPGDSLLLDVAQSGLSYLWQDGSTNASFKLGAAGNYAVSITDDCGMAAGDLEVSYRERISLELGEDVYLCAGETKLLDAYSPVEGAGYFWNVSDFDSVHLATKPGIYSVVVYSECEQVYDEINLMECFFCEVYTPNVFSPNFDGTNDYFRPYSNCPLENFKMTIYNRWGAEVFATNEVTDSWDGTVNGKDANLGIYLWRIEYTVVENGISRTEFIQGDVGVYR
ncbi:MAG: gliding motility-associated C-terminal domain-containing protein [Saprospiraceae bacterium]